ncbi:hypothetical protein PMAYCL1PPCAC_00991, partial [Pristionchus mayeri]
INDCYTVLKEALINAVDATTTTPTTTTTTTAPPKPCEQPIPDLDPKLKDFMTQYSCFQITYAFPKLKAQAQEILGFEIKDDDPNVIAFVDKYNYNTVYDSYQPLKEFLDKLSPTTTTAASTSTTDARTGELLNAYSYYRIKEKEQLVLDYINGY